MGPRRNYILHVQMSETIHVREKRCQNSRLIGEKDRVKSGDIICHRRLRDGVTETKEKVKDLTPDNGLSKRKH